MPCVKSKILVNDVFFFSLIYPNVIICISYYTLIFDE